MFTKVDAKKNRKLLSDREPELAIEWPQSRLLADYVFLLLKSWSFETLSNEKQLPEIIGFLALASHAKRFALAEINPDSKPIVVDIGLGDGFALQEIKKRTDFVTVGFGLHEINPENKPFIDLLCYSSFPKGPKARELFDLLRGKVSLVVEAYGASTYAKGESNSIESLIAASLLLAPGGTAKLIISCILKEDRDQSPMGFANQRQRLVTFIQRVLGIDIVISRTYIKSLVVTGSFCVDYHVEIKRGLEASVSDKPLDELFAMAREQIGHCDLVPKTTRFGEFGFYNIQGSTYTLEGQQPQLHALDTRAALVSSSFRFSGPQSNYPTFKLEFNSMIILQDFIVRFSEYYLNNKDKPEWIVVQNPVDTSVELAFTRPSKGLVNAMYQARLEINRVVPDLLTVSNKGFGEMEPPTDLRTIKSM